MKEDLKDVIKKQNKIASDWLINYRERKLEHEEKRQEIYTKKEKSEGLSTGLSKPTETIAITLADHDNNNTAKWLEVVEIVEGMLGYKKRLLLRLRQENKHYRYDSGKYGWIEPVQKGFKKHLGYEPAERTLHFMWEKIEDLTVRIVNLKNVKFLDLHT